MNETQQPAQKFSDGLWKSGRQYVWIKGQRLYLQPMRILHPLIVLTCGKPFTIVTGKRGRRMTFMRAADIIEEAPKLKPGIEAIAARFGVGV
jgi:hypothetical protein